MNQWWGGAARGTQAALLEQNPDYHDGTADIDALQQNLQGLAAVPALTDAQRNQQWRDFFVYVGQMASTHPGLSALIVAMTGSQAPREIPAAWTDLLAQMSKGASFQKPDEHQSMAAFHQPVTDGPKEDVPAMPARGRLPLAHRSQEDVLLPAWLGHLKQFDYRPSRYASQQTAQDRAIEAFVKQIAKFESDHVSVWQRIRGATRDTTASNAVRALTGASRPGDFSAAIVSEPRFKRLVGLVWHKIDQAPPADRENLRHSLLLALAECIDDDGHRVCDVGQLQRFTGVLAPSGMTPGQLLSSLAAELNEQTPEPTPAQVEDFVRSSRRAADDMFAEGSPERAAFYEDLDTYVRHNLSD